MAPLDTRGSPTKMVINSLLHDPESEFTGERNPFARYQVLSVRSPGTVPQKRWCKNGEDDPRATEAKAMREPIAGANGFVQQATDERLRHRGGNGESFPVTCAPGHRVCMLRVLGAVRSCFVCQPSWSSTRLFSHHSVQQ